MSIVSPPVGPPDTAGGVGPVAGSGLSLGRLFSAAFVILIGIPVGGVIAIIVAVLAGWIEVGC